MSNLVKLILSFQVITVLINTYLGVLVFRAQKSRFNVLFFIYTLGLSGWNLSLFLTITAIGGPMLQLLCSRLAFSFGVVMFNGFLYFAFIYPNITRVKLWAEIVIGILTASLVYLTLTPWLIKGNIKIINGAITGDIGPLMPIFSFYMPAFILLSAIVLIKKYLKSKGVTRVRIWYTLTGFLFFAVPMIITNLILPIFFNDYRFNNLGPIFSLPMVAIIGYMIVRHRFMGIRQAIARLVTYLFLTLFLGLIYAAGIWVISSFIIKNSEATTTLGVYTVFAVTVAFVFQPLLFFFEKLTNKIFYQHHYDGNQLLYSLALIMSSNLRLDGLLDGLIKEILSNIHINCGAFVLTENKKIMHVNYSGCGRKPVVSDKDLIALSDYSEIAVFDELTDGPIKRIMKKLEIKALIPLHTKKTRHNFLILGEKLSGEPYSAQDISILSVFAPSAAVAIDNTVSIEQIIRLDDLKSEFISVVSHQLRTPLSVTRWNFELLLDGTFGRLNDKIKNFGQDTYRAVMDLNQGLNNLMVSLEIEEKKLSLKYGQANFENDIVKPGLEASKKILKAKKIEIIEKGSYEKIIKLDIHKIQEVVVSLLNNAIEYSPEKSKIFISTVISKNNNHPELIFSVEDKGIGVPAENQKLIFQKFFRGEEAKNISPNGFGLSLFIAKAFIEYHGGRIWLEEKNGPGSKFCFSLPITKASRK